MYVFDLLLVLVSITTPNHISLPTLELGMELIYIFFIAENNVSYGKLRRLFDLKVITLPSSTATDKAGNSAIVKYYFTCKRASICFIGGSVNYKAATKKNILLATPLCQFKFHFLLHMLLTHIWCELHFLRSNAKLSHSHTWFSGFWSYLRSFSHLFND